MASPARRLSLHTPTVHQNRKPQSLHQTGVLHIDFCRDLSIEEILALPDVAEQVELFQSQHELIREQIGRVAQLHDNLVVLDLRDEDVIYAGNRFVVYAMFPECDISMHLMWAGPSGTPCTPSASRSSITRTPSRSAS